MLTSLTRTILDKNEELKVSADCLDKCSSDMESTEHVGEPYTNG
jgi:hypothetical protein